MMLMFALHGEGHPSSRGLPWLMSHRLSALPSTTITSPGRHGWDGLTSVSKSAYCAFRCPGVPMIYIPPTVHNYGVHSCPGGYKSQMLTVLTSE
jgi:hypothetical protein